MPPNPPCTFPFPKTLPTLEHPASLNARQQFRQACAIIGHTSRARLPAWYQHALEQDFQIHVRVDGPSIGTFFFHRPTDEWTVAPALSENALTDEVQAIDFGSQLLKLVRDRKGSSVGVVLHIADEFSTAELKPELDNPAALNDLRELAYHTPGEILDDSSVPPDQASWRVLPYPASGSGVIGTTITLSRRLDVFIQTLRQLGDAENFPIITHALSAPLVAIAGLPSVINNSQEKPFVAILQYPWFTAMAFFNEHSDLRLVRTIQHRGLQRPSSFRHALSTTNASLEFLDPNLYVIPLGKEIDKNIAQSLIASFSDSHVEVLQFPRTGKLPAWAPEPSISVQPTPIETEGISHTFGVLRQENWFLQDFLTAPREVTEVFPTRNEMRLLRLTKLARVAVFVLALAGVAWLGLSVFSIIRQPEWAFNAEDSISVNQQLLGLTQERQRVDHWNNLLDDRSKAWTSMEAIARLFPENSGLLLKTASHTVRPDSSPGQAKVGFIKEWVITGMAREEALSYLNTLNTRDGIATRFNEISQVTGNPAYDPTPATRAIVVNVKTQENSKFKQRPAEEVLDADDTTYPFTFNLTITQRFEATDPLAISASTAP